MSKTTKKIRSYLDDLADRASRFAEVLETAKCDQDDELCDVTDDLEIAYDAVAILSDKLCRAGGEVLGVYDEPDTYSIHWTLEERLGVLLGPEYHDPACDPKRKQLIDELWEMIGGDEDNLIPAPATPADG